MAPCRLQYNVRNFPFEQKIEVASFYITLSLTVVDEHGNRIVSVPVLLMVISKAAQHGYQGPVASFFVPIILCKVREGEQICNLEQLAYSV